MLAVICCPQKSQTRTYLVTPSKRCGIYWLHGTVLCVVGSCQSQYTLSDVVQSGSSGVVSVPSSLFHEVVTPRLAAK